MKEANFGFAKVVVHDVLTSQVTKLIKVGQKKKMLTFLSLFFQLFIAAYLKFSGD